MKGPSSLLVLLVFLAGTAQALVWPAPPDAPRVKFMAAFPREGEPAQVEPEPFLKRSLWFILGISRRPGASRAGPVFRRPTGLAVVGDTAYVADLAKKKIIKYDLGTGRAADIPKSGPVLSSPVGVAAARGGRIFVSDSAKREVYIFDADGHADGRLAAPPGGWARPTGLAMDQDRELLYVADTGRHRIQVYRLDGGHLRAFGSRGGGPGQFNYPTYLNVETKTGRLLVCDSLNNRIQVFGADGGYIGEFGKAGDRPGYLARPRGLGVDSEGNIYVADGAFESVQVFDAQGRLLLFFGSSGGDPGSFSLPGGVFVDQQDRIFVADTYNARLQMFQYLPGGKT